MFSPSVLWPSLTSIMNYPLCMTHDLATANRHDHTWTETWAQNICTLRKPLSLMRPWYAHRQGGRRRHLYGTKDTWINYPASCALLDVGFIFILRRTDIFILIWACTAVLSNITTVIFSNYPSSQTKLLRSLAFAAMLCRCCSRNGACEAVW